MANTIQEKIEEDAISGIAQVTSDGLTVIEKSISELIAADQYQKGVDATAAGVNPWAMLRPTQMIPPGSV